MTLLVLEGPDMCGKTNIAAALRAKTGIPVFKNSGEWETDLRSPDYFKNLLRFGGTFLLDFLAQVRPDAIFDRFYPSELVYSTLFDRDTDVGLIMKMDARFAELGGMIVICRRRSYVGQQDDLHSYLDSEKLASLDRIYESFSKLTVCRTLTLWVDDEDLDRQIGEIENFMKGEKQ